MPFWAAGPGLHAPGTSTFVTCYFRSDNRFRRLRRGTDAAGRRSAGTGAALQEAEHQLSFGDISPADQPEVGLAVINGRDAPAGLLQPLHDLLERKPRVHAQDVF